MVVMLPLLLVCCSCSRRCFTIEYAGVAASAALLVSLRIPTASQIAETQQKNMGILTYIQLSFLRVVIMEARC